MEQKLQNPDFNVDAVMEGAARAIGGQIDPIELRKKLLDAEAMNSRIEAAKKEAYEAAKHDMEQQIKNQKPEVPTLPAFSSPKFTVPTTGTKNGLHTLREKAAERIAKQFGPGVFLGG